MDQVNKMSDSDFLSTIAMLRAELPSRIRDSGNFAIAQVIINGKKGLFYASSVVNSLDQFPELSERLPGISVQPKVIYYNARDGINSSGKIFFRDSCAEYKIFNDIASRLQPGAAGELTIFMERTPCDSCKNIINHFMDDFPNIEIEIIHNKRKTVRAVK